MHPFPEHLFPTHPEDLMQKLRIESLKVESFATTAAAELLRGTVAAHDARPSLPNCPVSYGGTCIISVCTPCYTDDPCG